MDYYLGFTTISLHCNRSNPVTVAVIIDRKASNLASANLSEIASQMTLKPIQIMSNPTDSEIVLDGLIMGTTPKILNIGPGNHTLELDKNGYMPYKIDLNYSKGAIYKINLTAIDNKQKNRTSINMKLIDSPIAVAEFSPISPAIGDDVTFDASQSRDLNGIN